MNIVESLFLRIRLYVVPVKSKVEISQNFVAFSEYMNFTYIVNLHFHYINIDKWILNLSQKLQFISKYLLTLSQNFAKFLHNDCATDFVVLKMTGPWYEEYLMNSFLTHKAYFFMHLLNSQLFLGPIYNRYWSVQYLNFRLGIKNESFDI